MMNTLYKKVVLTGMVVLVAFVITIGSTFAWFTIGQASSIEDIDLTISSSESILILMDEGYSIPASNAILNNPSSYKSVLRNSDITPVYDFTNGKITMKPLTSINGLAITHRDGNPASFAPKVETEDPAGDYIQFSVWLLSQSAPAEIAISDLTLSVPSNQLVEKAIVMDSVRLSIDALDANANAKRIYGLDKDYGFTFGVNDIGYDATPESTANAIVPSIATNLIDAHHAVFHTTGTPEAGESTNDKTLATRVFDLAANTPTKVTIRIWIEGWDAQANNNLIGAVFNIAFSFIAKPQA